MNRRDMEQLEEAVSELIDFGMIVADERHSIRTHIAG